MSNFGGPPSGPPGGSFQGRPPAGPGGFAPGYGAPGPQGGSPGPQGGAPGGFGAGYGAPSGGSHAGARHDSNNRGGFQWVSASNGHIPPNSVQGGIEKDGKPLFVARAMYKGGLHPGKAAPHLNHGGCNIGYGHKEVSISEYQVLCGDASKLRWVRQEGPLVIQDFVPIQAGHEESGEPLYVAKTLVEGSQQIGKCAPHIKKGMSFPFGHKEKTTDNYMVLAYAD